MDVIDKEVINHNPVEGIKSVSLDKMDNDSVYGILVDNEIGWQAILYDLINTEQLDPWNLDLVALTQKYLEKVRQLEEANFFISSNIILAASFLLRIKSDILLNTYIPSLDEILFGKKEGKKYTYERIEIDERELPLIYPKSPMPRMKQVTLEELMSALNKAITTENRRIRKEIVLRVARRETEIVFPRMKVRIQDRIRQIYAKILSKFKQKKQRVPYSELALTKEEKIAGFLPVLHLDNQQKVFLQQEKHYEEIYIWLFHHYRQENPQIVASELAEETTDSEIKAEEEHRMEDFDKYEQEIINEINKEDGLIKATSKINSVTGFENPLGELLGEAK